MGVKRKEKGISGRKNLGKGMDSLKKIVYMSWENQTGPQGVESDKSVMREMAGKIIQN